MKELPGTKVNAKLQKAVEARNACEKDFLSRRNVVAVAIGFRIIRGRETDEICVKAYVRSKVAESHLPPDEALPSKVPADGGPVPVDVERMEQPVAINLRERIRPVVGGYSVAHCAVTAGTVATAVRDRQQSAFYLLSNNHVLANANDANLGDPILQPGPADGGSYPQDLIARLCRFVPVRFDGSTNLVDAAIGCIVAGDVERRVYWIGEPVATRRRAGVNLGEQLQKTGRTTAYTRGRISGLHGTVSVNYGAGRTAVFREQIITSPMSEGGDSGSLVLDLGGNALGLLFAGSSTHTILNNIEDVQTELGVLVAETMV